MKYCLSIVLFMCCLASFGQSAEELNGTFMKLKGEGNYKEALAISAKLLDAVEKKFGKKSLEFGTIQYHIAVIYEDINDYSNAESFYKKATETFRLASGDESGHYGQGLHNLANFYKDRGSYPLSEQHYKKAIQVYKKSIGEEHERYGDCLDNYGVLLIYMGNYIDAKPLIEKGAEIRKTSQGDKSSNYGSSLSNLGLLNEKFGNYKEAISFYIKAMNTYKQALGEKHSYYASTLTKLAYVFQLVGNYTSAEVLYNNAISIYEKTLGKNSDDYAFAIARMGSYYGETGNFAKAEPLLKESLTIIQNILGNKHPFYATAVDNLGKLYILMGNYGKGASLLNEALETIKQNFGENSLEFARGITGVAHVLTLSGQYEDAEKLGIKAVEFFEKAAATNLPEYTGTLRLLSLIYQQTNKLDKSKAVLSKALATTKAALGKEHVDYASTLVKLAYVEEKLMNYLPAEKYYKEAITIYKNALGEKHVDYAKTLIEAGNMLSHTNKTKEAEDWLINGTQLMLSYIQQNFFNLSETEKMKWWQTNSSYFECVPSYLMLNKNASKSFLEQACSIQMQLKGAVLSDGANTFYKARKKGSPALLSLIDQWQANKALLANQYSIPVTNRLKNIDSLEKACNEQEKDINNQSSVLSSFAKYQQTGFKDIQQKLKAKEAAIEFVKFELFNHSWTDSIMYAAFVVLPNNTAPYFVSLCLEGQLSKLLDSKNSSREGFVKQLYRSSLTGRDNSSTLHKGDSLYALIIKPLLPLLKNIDQVSIAPVGLLNRVSFDALPLSKDSLLINRFAIRQFNAIRQMAEQTDSTKTDNAVFGTVYGGINYNVSKPEKPKFNRGNIALPDNVKRDIGGSGFTYLDGTLKEANGIDAIFTANQKTNKLLLDTLATEESFKGMSGNSPKVIHLATHGFSLPNPNKKNENSETGNQFSLAENPLLRSGIIMAGANHAWTGGTTIKGKEDGILTAYEIANLDLSNTELVVLSACETALGDIKGTEGVFGLQRAFKLAGVRKMIMSLWQVPDKETAELMNSFYGNWFKGESIHDAFNHAKSAMQKKYSAFYWAAFVLIE